MADALIGFTGFVGGNLLTQRGFDAIYHSKNIESIAGRAFQCLVCAGAPAEKWKANQNPQADWAGLERLMNALKQVEAERLILISTIDVYGQTVGVTEETEPSGAGAYGRHRQLLEQFARDRFDALIVRLPGLFAPGLKKNAIYDLLHDNQVDRIDSRSRYQFYPVESLWHDVSLALAAGVNVIHFATEPVSMGEVAREGFGRAFLNEIQPSPAEYDFRTCHADLYGGANGYLLSREQVLSRIRDYVTRERDRSRCA